MTNLDPAAVDVRVAAPLNVVDQVKRYILLHRLHPGDPLPTENELSKTLGVGRSRIREAMKTLSALDIVEVRHGYGTYVGQLRLTALVEALAFRGMLSHDDDTQHVMADLIDLREFIEVSLSERIVSRMSPESAARMAELARTMQQKAAQDEPFTEEDREFHQLMVETSHNALAQQLTGAFWDVHVIALSSLGEQGDLLPTAEAHQAIVDAIEAADAEELMDALHEHYAPVRERMARELAGSGSAAD